MRIAVTGCASDFASAILPRLFADPEVEEVVGCDLRDPRVSHEKLRFEREDVRSPRMRELFDGCEAIVHLAFVMREVHDKRLTHDVNLNGSRNVLEAAEAAGANRLVIASSIAAYGVHSDHPVPLTEEDFPRGNPDKYYFYDKAEVEHYVLWWRTRNPASRLVVTLLRPTVICGPHIRNPLVEALARPVLALPLEGGYRWQLLYEDDLADAFHRAAKADHPGPFNVGPDDDLPADELAEIHGQRLFRVPMRLAAPVADALFSLRIAPGSSQWVVRGESRVDASRLKRETGWRPRLTSREAAHVMLLHAGRPILRSNGELHRREVAEAALAPVTAIVRDWCDEIPGLRSGVGGASGFDAALQRLEHVFLPFKTGDLHAELHPADSAGAPTVIFSPGLGGHARFYTPALAAMRDAGFNAIGVDRPGHGLSEGRRGDAPIELTLDALDAVIRYARERLGGAVALTGTSLGGIITWYALTREPDIEAAVCHNVSHPEVLHEPAMRVKVPLMRRLARAFPVAPLPIKQVADFGEVALDARSRAFFENEVDPLWCWRVSMRSVASFFEYDPPLDWSAVRTPTLVLVGDADRMVDADFTRRVMDRSRPPDSELRVLPGLGHMVFGDHLVDVVDEVTGFLREHLREAVPA